MRDDQRLGDHVAAAPVRGIPLADLFASTKPTLTISIVCRDKGWGKTTKPYIAQGARVEFERPPGNLEAEIDKLERKAQAVAEGEAAKVIDNYGGIARIALIGSGNNASRVLLAEKKSWSDPWRAPGKPVPGDYDPIEPFPSFYNVLQYGTNDELLRMFVVDVAGGVYDDSQFDHLDEGVTVTVYRGISLPEGVDPTTTSKGRDGAELGSSWTLDEEAAMAIAERGQAGFEGDNKLRNDAFFVQIRELQGSRDGAGIPTVLRAEVTIAADGAAPYRPWSNKYVSEMEIDIPRGQEVTITGWRQATPVPVKESDKRQAEKAYQRSLELEKQEKYDDPAWMDGRSAGYYVHWKWGAWKKVNVKRKASHDRLVSTARVKTFVRGFTLALSKPVAEQFLAALKSGRLSDAGAIVAKWAEGDQDGYNDGTGVGEWWAENHAGIDSLYGSGGTLELDGEWFFNAKPRLGVMLEADIETADMLDHNRLKPNMSVQLREVRVNYTEGREYKWLSLPVSMRVKASLVGSQRTAARDAGGTVLYRGLDLLIPLEDYLARGNSVIADAVLAAATEPYLRETGIGVHWTTSLSIAEQFAWGEVGEIPVRYPYRDKGGPISIKCPVVLVGRPAFGAIRMDDSVYRDYKMTNPNQIDPDYMTSVFESEIPIAKGGEILLDHARVAMPARRLLQPYADMEERKRPIFERVVEKSHRPGWDWITVRTPLRVKAARTGTIRLHHGTTSKQLDSIRRQGKMRVMSPTQIAAELEREFSLPRGAVASSPLFSFSADRASDPYIYLSGDPQTARSYASGGPEIIFDALNAVWSALNPGDRDITDPVARQREPWVRREMKRLCGDPVVVTVDLPIDYVWERLDDHTRRVLKSVDQFAAEFIDSPSAWNTLTLRGPIDAQYISTSTRVAMQQTAAFADTLPLSRIYNRIRNEVMPLLSDAALSSRDRWVNGGGGIRWPDTFLAEVSTGAPYAQTQRILHEEGFPAEVSMVRDSLTGNAEFVNASLWSKWLDRSVPDRVIFTVLRSDIVGFGSFSEDEVFVRSKSIRREAMAAGPVTHMGTPKLKYDYYGTVERIAILDPEADPPKKGETYFTVQRVEDPVSVNKRLKWDRGEGWNGKPRTKTRPKLKYRDGTGTADEGTIAFLDFIDSPSSKSIFIAFMNVRDDHRHQGHANKLVDWVYAEAKRRGRSEVHWGTVFYPANRMYWKYYDRPNNGIATTGHPLDGRNVSLASSPTVDIEAWVRSGLFTFGEAVARVNGQPVGFLHADGDQGTVESVYVTPKHRRQGIATRMLRAVEDKLGKRLVAGQELGIDGAAWSNAVTDQPDRQPTTRQNGQWEHLLDQYDRESPSKKGLSTSAATDDSLDRALRDLADAILTAPPSKERMNLWGDPPPRQQVDWASTLRKHRVMYRGLGVRHLAPELVDAVFDTTIPESKRAAMVLDAVRSSAGMHWTFDRGEAAGFAGMAADKGDLRVILVADSVSADDVITDEDTLHRNQVFDLNSEQEVPVKPGTRITIREVQWAPGGPRPILKSDDGGGWVKARLGVSVTAAFGPVQAAVTMDDLAGWRTPFIEVQRGTTVSGWKAHIFARDTFEVSVILRRIQPVLKADPDMSCKAATQTFFDQVSPGDKSYGKGVTLYLPRRATVDRDLDKIVAAMGDWAKGDIDGDTYVGNGVWKRYELSEQIDYDIELSDMGEYHRLYKPASALSAVQASGLAPILYWRTHPRGRPFSPEDATSTTFQGGIRSIGYSCFDNPWHLWLYLDAMQWYVTAQSQDIIGFTGERIGTGNDGEDLVMPDMRTVLRMSFSDFETDLANVPLPPTPTFGPGWDGYSSWKTLARTWKKYFNAGDSPLMDIVLKQGSSKVGTSLSALTLYHGTRDVNAHTIHRSGLTSSGDSRMTLTTDFNTAANFATSRKPMLQQDRSWDRGNPGDLRYWTPAVVRFDLPLDVADEYVTKDQGGYSAHNGNFDAYAVKKSIPARYVTSVTVLPKWADDSPLSDLTGRQVWEERYASRQASVATTTMAYRGVPVELTADLGVPILEALAQGKKNLAAQLLIDAMTSSRRFRWWAAGEQPDDEAGRWWTSSERVAWRYAGTETNEWMMIPVVMTAEFDDPGDADISDGTYYWHLPTGHPLKIVRFEADLPDDPQSLLDDWRGVTSPGNFDPPGRWVWPSTTQVLPIPPMRATARVNAG